MARFKSHRIDATAAIPLRPELIEFMYPQSLGLMSCVSATLRKDVLESKAWTLMANAHLPRSAEEAALAVERAAAVRLRSQVLRRRLADSMSRAQPHRLVPNKLDDFTFFVRFEEDGKVLWEGDVAVAGFHTNLPVSRRKFVELSMSEAWSAIKDRGSFIEIPDDADDYWDRVQITLIVIRNEDQAMIPLGSFRFDSDPGDPSFHSSQALYQTEQFEILLELFVNVDNSELNSLELSVEIHDRTIARIARFDRWLGDLTKQRVGFLFTYLAGAYDYRSRPHALATFESWYEHARGLQ